ncbi:MAG: histone deacetylase [Bacteriovoracaceae bacterium]|nr:histone deacetylase [Bacteriovoracaceae bacterium]
MILFKPYLHPNFLDYGIQIPIADDRASKAFEYLQQRVDGVKSIDFIKNQKITRDDLLRVHTQDYVDIIYNNPTLAVMSSYELIDEKGNYKRYDPALAKKTMKELVDHKLMQTAGTFQAMSYALENGMCYYLGGGMHHAMSFGGRGFCLVNDIVIGLKKLMNNGDIISAWVIDVDAHKGDGTAELTKDDSFIKTLSIHMESGWPLDGPRFDDNDKLYPWHIPSDIDIPIAKGMDDTYLDKLEAGLDEFSRFSKPDICVVVNGADPFGEDELESAKGLCLTEKEMFIRDRTVYEFLKSRNIPQVYTIAGGYGSNAWKIYANFLTSIFREEGYVFQE